MRTVIFDLDGTLADTSGDLLAAANACFRGLGLGDLLGPADAPTALRGGRAMLRLGLARAGRADEAEVDRQYPILLQCYEDAICRTTTLYPGAAEAVVRLRRAGWRTGICTNKPERLSILLLDALGVLHLFDSLVGADTLPVRKPDPAPLRAAVAWAGGCLESACLIGDTRTDWDCARAAGVPCLLVGFGPDPMEAARLGAPVLRSFDGLEAALDALGRPLHSAALA
ncbi:HAD-IA family hydrolase [Rubellimicrobium sp. CFH 75288]|uniref:HAD-IA family hydrolase n=1 Tax=Rubellimicrobium sp. CFH 75288 TaxID=2697034 RepID=UPI0014127164|nr:HAD-IA family hydrolase [Rubellimicrobium sp. CFH 75288]NAZ36071.1 HAD-IA family hydrolase [Rubellimicrobium sp. CFH 75288]